ncbi:MAG: TetR/AcrR family transcriptional regulator [Paracoccaceae bacterium]
MTRAPGRPARAAAPVTRDEMLAEAMAILSREGAERLTMRALAARLAVTPMTIHHHFGGRDGLIAAMADRLYAPVAAPDEGTAVARIRGLLLAYHGRVLLCPALTLLIFSHPRVFPAQARRIADDLSALLAEMGLTPERARRWRDILVDVTHGAGLATAMMPEGETDPGTQAAGYAECLEELLTALHG